MKIHCVRCSYAFPDTSMPFCCPRCGGIFDYIEQPDFNISKLDKNKKGVLRYKEIIELPDNISKISLGEGNTPLVSLRFQNKNIFIKSEYLNPTGSYKDRGSISLVGSLMDHKIIEVVEDSSGNAGASLAAYSSRAGIKANIFIPAGTSGPKKTQIEAYGATIHSIPGSRADAANAVLEVASQGMTYASHAFMPFGLLGIATIAWEIFEELGTQPGSVICPVGHGGALLGIANGFMSLRNAGLIDQFPFLFGVQASAYSPIVNAYNSNGIIKSTNTLTSTIAEGIQVKSPSRGEALLRIIQREGGKFESVTDDEIVVSHGELAGMGHYVEPTSAVVWAALKNNFHILPEPIILILTGSGLKYRP